MATGLEDLAAKEKARLRRAHVRVGSMGLLGVSNMGAGASLALTGGADGAAAAMRWDLVNPWARWFQLNATHPLTALRIQALNREAERMHQPVSHPLPAERRVAWGTFPMEVLLWAAPFVLGVAALLAIPVRHFAEGMDLRYLAPALLTMTGIAWELRTWLRYVGTFQPATIAGLMDDVHVSEMRPRAVRLEGTIVGFGVPGAFYCADLVLRDSTGIIFMLYKESIPLARLMFAFTASAGYIGQKVVIDGWFRRGMRPYIEMGRLTGEDGVPLISWARSVQHIMAALLAVGGLLWLMWR